MVGLQLFNAMISYLPRHASSMGLILYADDGKAVGNASSVLNCRNNQTDLNAIYRWSVSNRLPLNLAKCQCLHIRYGNLNYVSTLGGQPIAIVEQCTDLGLTHTKNFSYSAHINSIICKASRAAGLVYRMVSTRDQTFIKKIIRCICQTYPGVCISCLEPYKGRPAKRSRACSTSFY